MYLFSLNHTFPLIQVHCHDQCSHSKELYISLLTDWPLRPWLTSLIVWLWHIMTLTYWPNVCLCTLWPWLTGPTVSSRRATLYWSSDRRCSLEINSGDLAAISHTPSYHSLGQITINGKNTKLNQRRKYTVVWSLDSETKTSKYHDLCSKQTWVLYRKAKHHTVLPEISE